MRGRASRSGLRALLIQKGVKHTARVSTSTDGLRALLIQKGVKQYGVD